MNRTKEPTFTHVIGGDICQTERTFDIGDGGARICDAHDRRVKEQATYVVPFTHDRIKVTVLSRAFRNGRNMVHILLPYKGWDLWVPETRVS